MNPKALVIVLVACVLGGMGIMLSKRPIDEDERRRGQERPVEATAFDQNRFTAVPFADLTKQTGMRYMLVATLLRDTETGREYVVVRCADGIAITPRLDTQDKP